MANPNPSPTPTPTRTRTRTRTRTPTPKPTPTPNQLNVTHAMVCSLLEAAVLLMRGARPGAQRVVDTVGSRRGHAQARAVRVTARGEG